MISTAALPRATSSLRETGDVFPVNDGNDKIDKIKANLNWVNDTLAVQMVRIAFKFAGCQSSHGQT